MKVEVRKSEGSDELYGMWYYIHTDIKGLPVIFIERDDVTDEPTIEKVNALADIIKNHWKEPA